MGEQTAAAALWGLENEEIDGKKIRPSYSKKDGKKMISSLLDEDSVVQSKVTGISGKFRKIWAFLSIENKGLLVKNFFFYE